MYRSSTALADGALWIQPFSTISGYCQEQE